MPDLSPQATAITVDIAGIDQTSLLVAGSVSTTGRLNQRWEASCRLFDPDGTYDPQAGQHVILYETPHGGSPQRCFTGLIEDVSASRVVNHSLGSELFLEVRCVDLMSRLEQRVCSEPSTHRGKTCGWLIYFAMQNFAWSEGIGFDFAASPGGFIEAGPVVEKYVFNKQTVAQVIEDMGKLADKVGFIDVNGDLHFEDVGATMAAPFSISASSANFTKVSVRRSKSEGAGSAGSGYFNQSFTRTSWAAWEQRHNTFVGDGSSTSWTLYDPDSSPSGEMAAAIVVDVKVNGKSVDFGGEEEGRAYTWSYGESTLTQAAGEAVLTDADTLEVWFHDMAQGYIFKQDLTEITARGLIESNSGQCTRIFDDSQETSFQAADDKAQAALDLSKTIIDVVTLNANGFGPNPIYPRPGMVFSASLSYPSISGEFSIQEVSAQEIAGAGLAYACKCVTKASSRRLANELDYFRELARKKPGSSVAGGAGDGGPKSGPIAYRTLVKDTTPGNSVADVVSVYGVVIQQASRIRRILASPRVLLVDDLEVRYNVRYPGGESHIIGTFTVPASSTPGESVAFLPPFGWDVLPDKSTLSFDIKTHTPARTIQKEKNGVCSFVIETIGRGGELPTAEGVGWQSTWDSGTTYAKDDVVHYNGSTYISLQSGNTGNTPGSSPTWWDLLASKGDTGTDEWGTITGTLSDQTDLQSALDAKLDDSQLDTDGTLAANSDAKIATQKAVKTYVDGHTGASAWGSITGTLSSQTDLQSALDAKLDDSQLDTDGTLAANSDTKIASQKAVKTYVDAHGGGSGTVTHTGGALTADLPVFGNGSDDIKVGTKSGDTNKVVTQGTGTPSTGQPLLYDASGNAIPGLVKQLVPSPPSDATQFLNGAATPAFAQVKDSDLALSDVTTNNASTGNHGFLKKLSGSSGDVMRGDGTWGAVSGGAGGGLVLLAQQTASNSPSLDFASCISSSYDRYLITVAGIVPASNGVSMLIQVSSDGGSTWDTTSGNYEGCMTYDSSDFADSNHANALTTATGMFLWRLDLSNSSSAGIDGQAHLFDPLNTSRYKRMIAEIYGMNTSNHWYRLLWGARWKSTAAYNAFRVIASGGNIASGTVRVYGYAQ